MKWWPTPTVGLLALDARITIDGGAYSVWPFTIGLEPGQPNLPGPYAFKGYRCETKAVATNKPGFVPYRGVARTGVCFAMELTMDAIAREVGREPWEIRRENGAGRTDALRQRHRQAPGQRRLSGQPAAGHGHDRCGRYPRAPAAASRPASSAWAWPPTRSRPRTAPRCSPPGARPSFRASTGHGRTPDGGLELGSACIRTRAWKRLPRSPTRSWAWTWPASSCCMAIPGRRHFPPRVGVHSHGQGGNDLAQIANEILGVDVASIKLLHGDTGQTPFSTGTYASRSLVMSGGAVSQAQAPAAQAHAYRRAPAGRCRQRGRTATGWKRAASRCRSATGRRLVPAAVCRPTWIPPD